MEIKRIIGEWKKLEGKNERVKLSFIKENIESFSSARKADKGDENQIIIFIYQLSELLKSDHRLFYASVIQIFQNMELEKSLDIENETHSKLSENIVFVYNKMGKIKESKSLVNRFWSKKKLNDSESKALEESFAKKIMNKKNIISVPFMIANIIALVLMLNWIGKTPSDQNIFVGSFIALTLILGSIREIFFYRFLKKNGITRSWYSIVVEWIIGSLILILFLVTQNILFIVFFVANSLIFENEMQKRIKRHIAGL